MGKLFWLNNMLGFVTYLTTVVWLTEVVFHINNMTNEFAGFYFILLCKMAKV